MHRFFFPWSLSILLFLFAIPTFLEKIDANNEYQADYQVVYDLRRFRETQAVEVRFHIRVINLRSDFFVNKFIISLPSRFYIDQIRVFDDTGEVNYQIITNGDITKIEMPFLKPRTGKNSINNLYLNFVQKNLFKINGQIWEVVLPVLERKEGENYLVEVVLPENSEKKISLSKPKPTLISGREIVWENPKTKMIYAVFGDFQIYQAQLTYHLKNQEVFPVTKEIALPPETPFQKIYLESLEPPKAVFVDDDGNYLARYTLKPLESRKITFRGHVRVFSRPRQEMVEINRKRLAYQKKYLLRAQKYWSLKNEDLDRVKTLRTIPEIYSFVVDTLRYNYQKLNQQNPRLGAERVLDNPSYAVCLEFTDLFVSIAREKGFFARQISGYGFSFDPKLQPISLKSDILHAWPEYYDELKQMWIPVDPTWENTSGIDYFSSFDLNHIVFTIHGRSNDSPIPAGMYKVDDSKDIIITTSNTLPQEKKILRVRATRFVKESRQDNKFSYVLRVRNEGNVFLINQPLRIESQRLGSDQQKKFILELLAPFQEKELKLSFYYSQKAGYGKDSLKIFFNDQKIHEEMVDVRSSIVSPLRLGTIFSFSIGVVFLIVRKFFLK